jgi:hypothetical protein
MTTEDLTTEVPLKISLGHLLLVWDILANKLPGSPVLEDIGDDEQRAMAALQDLCENTLQANGIAGRPKAIGIGCSKQQRHTFGAYPSNTTILRHDN